MLSRVVVIIFCIALVAHSLSASPRSRFQPGTDAWVNNKVDALVRTARAAFESDQESPYKQVLKSITDEFRRYRICEDDKFASRYREFIDYVQAASLEFTPGHELGFVVPDRQYFAETRKYVEIPEFLMDQSFITAVSRFETLDRAKAFLRSLNSTRAPEDKLIFFSYKSRHLGTPDNDRSFWRLLIVVPGNTEIGVPEKWVQFGITDPKTRVRIRNVSVVAAVPRSDGTFNAYFKDSFRTFYRDKSIAIKGRWELGFGDDNCARCHKSGVLPIFPVKGSVSKDEQPLVNVVNERLRSYGSPRFDKYLDQTKFGPGLSYADSEQRTQRFGEKFPETTVGRAMRCVSCHQPESFGALNWPMDQVLISSVIRSGQMPMGYKLTAAERDELYDNLIEEYFATDNANPGILKSWLLGARRIEHR
jgi:hypothetical protein